MGDSVQAANRLESKMDATAVRFGANRQALMTLLGGMRSEEDRIREGGGAKAAEAQKAKGRLTVRERLALLLDSESLQGSVTRGDGAISGSNFLELGLWAAHGMY